MLLRFLPFLQAVLPADLKQRLHLEDLLQELVLLLVPLRARLDLLQNLNVQPLHLLLHRLAQHLQLRRGERLSELQQHLPHLLQLTNELALLLERPDALLENNERLLEGNVPALQAPLRLLHQLDLLLLRDDDGLAALHLGLRLLAKLPLLIKRRLQLLYPRLLITSLYFQQGLLLRQLLVFTFQLLNLIILLH